MSGSDRPSRRLAAVRDRAGRPAGGRAQPFAAGVPDGRPQAAHRDRPRDGRRASASSAGRLPMRRRWTRSRPGWKAPRFDVTAEPQTLADNRRVGGLISFRDPAGNRLEAFYGAEIDETPFQPRPFDLRFPHRPARPRPCRADGREHRCDDGVLCRRARLRAQRLHRKAVPRLFLSRQCAASQPGADRDRQATACTI